MKFAITGHTQGIGFAISQNTHVQDHFVGFSKSNGYDISCVDDRARIIKEAVDCDVFINNAYCGHAQTDLLYELYKHWSNKKKIIVNIGSATTSGIKDHVWPYSAHKASLEKASEQLSFLSNSCQVILIKFGWVGTKRILNQFKPANYIAPEDAADFVLEQIKWCQKYRLVTTMLQPSTHRT